MKVKTIYLAGGKSLWRVEFDEALGEDHQFELINPMEEENEYNATPLGYVVRDLALLDRSDAIVACIDFHQYSGLAAELGIGHARGMPMILINKLGRVDMFVGSFCRAVFTDITTAGKFVAERWQ